MHTNSVLDLIGNTPLVQLCGEPIFAKAEFLNPGVGSGGTLQRIGKFLKEHRPKVKVIAVEPKNVAALLGHEPGLHQIQGIGDEFIPGVLDVSLVDEVIEVTDDDAIETTRRLATEQGLLVFWSVFPAGRTSGQPGSWRGRFRETLSQFCPIGPSGTSARHFYEVEWYLLRSHSKLHFRMLTRSRATGTTIR